MTAQGNLTLLVAEIYRSIQGESTHAGRPCTFVRLTGCPLRCVWCDTAYAFEGGERMTIDAILKEVEGLGARLVEVTGGEPLAQAECLVLLKALCDAEREVLLETSGALDVSGVDERVIKIMDLKCPASGESNRNLWENLDALGPRDEIKFVIANRGDYEWARGVIHERRLEGKHELLFSPVHGKLDPAEPAKWIQEDGLRARLQVQLHKYLWPGRDKGV